MLAEFPLRREHHHEVAGFGESGDLARENLVVAEIMPMHVTSEPSDEELRWRGSERRVLTRKRPTSSVAKCAASAALPPLPQIKSFPPRCSVGEDLAPARIDRGADRRSAWRVRGRFRASEASKVMVIYEGVIRARARL